MRSRPGKRLRPAHFSVWTPSGAALPEQQAPALVAPKSPNPRELLRWPESKTDRSAATDTNPPSSSNPPLHGPALLFSVAHSGRPSAAGPPTDKPPYRAALPARNGPPAARAPDAPASTRGDSISWEGRVTPRAVSHSGGKPSHSMRCRDPARRLQTGAAFAANVAGARQKTQTRPGAGTFPSKACNPLWEQPSTFARFVPVRDAGTLRDHPFLWGFLSWALKKSNASVCACLRQSHLREARAASKFDGKTIPQPTSIP